MTEMLIDTAKTHRIADASLEQWTRVRKSLTLRETRVMQAMAEMGRDATGGELAQLLGWPVTSVRPRLTALADKGLVLRGAIRQSRVALEGRCHGYTLAVPIAAVLR
jgi:DNA-binding MarR family transcriptional regulator